MSQTEVLGVSGKDNIIDEYKTEEYNDSKIIQNNKRAPGTPLTPSVQPIAKKRAGRKYLEFEDDDERRIQYEHWLLQSALDKNREVESFRQLEKRLKDEFLA